MKLLELYRHLMAKVHCLGVRWMYLSTNFIFMPLNFDFGCFSFFLNYQKQKSNLISCILWEINHWSWFQGLKYRPSSFWPRVANHAVNFEKVVPLLIAYFNYFLWYKTKLLRKPKIFLKVIQTIGCVEIVGNKLK